MKRYESYKNSGIEWIGEIPSHWIIKRIKYLSTNHHNSISLEEMKGLQLIHYSIPNVQEYGKGIEENGGDIDSSKIVLEEGLIIISKLNPRKGTITIVDKHDKLIVGSGEFIPLKFKQDDTKFRFFQLSSSRFIESMDSQVESVTRSHQRIRPESLFISELPTPPLIEQIQIVDYLDHKTSLIDDLIGKKQKKIELLKEKRIALINHAVTKGLNPNVEMKDSGVEWIGEIPEHWEIKKVSYICQDMISGPFGSSLKKEFYTKSGYKIYGQEQVINDDFKYGDYHISEEKFKELARCEIFPNDILISCVGTFGKIALVPEQFERGIINPRLLKLTPNELVNPKYLLILMRSDITYSQFDSLSRGGTMGVINLDILRQLKFPILKISEQLKIVEYLDEQTQLIDSNIEKEQLKIDLLKEYRQSLISEVVTGKIDVRIN